MNRTVIFLVGSGLLLSCPTALQAAVESQDYVLEQPTFTYGYGATESDDYQLEGSIGQGGESEGEMLLRTGNPGSDVLPTPRPPQLTVIDGTSLKAVVDVGDNDPHVLVQLEVRETGSVQPTYYGTAGRPVTEANSWGVAAIWRDGVTLHQLNTGATYAVRARVRSNEAAVSDYSPSSFVTMTGQAVADQNKSQGGTVALPPALAQLVDAWLDSPTGQAAAAVAEKVVVPLVLAGAAVQVVAASSLLGPILGDLLARLILGISSGSNLFMFFRRRRDIGQVIDGETGRPITGARVSLLRPDTKIVVESQVTDSEGRYLFAVDTRQIFIVRVEAEKHEPYEQTVKGAAVNQRVVLGVSLEFNQRSLARYQRVDSVFRLLAKWRVPLLVLGTAAWMVLFLRDGGYTIWLGVYYALAWGLELFVRLQPQPYGKVQDKLTGDPLSAAVIRISNKQGRLISTLVTGESGRFSTLMRPGTYGIKVSKAGYQTSDLIWMRFSRRGSAQALNLSLTPITDRAAAPSSAVVSNP